MKISIVTISFNQREFLRQCIESVLMQEDPDCEHIIVDPGSVDGSRDIIESYRDKVIPVFEPDGGPADGLNKGFSRATGDVFAFLNSDDEFFGGAFARARAAMSSGAYDVVCGSGFLTDRNGVPTRRVVPTRFTPLLHAYNATQMFQQATFFTATCFRKVGGFNRDNRTSWDGELLLDMALAGARFGAIPGNIAKFRIHESSITGSQRMADAFKRDRERLFVRVMQRPKRKSDYALSFAARGLKYLSDPKHLLRRFGYLG